MSSKKHSLIQYSNYLINVEKLKEKKENEEKKQTFLRLSVMNHATYYSILDFFYVVSFMHTYYNNRIFFKGEGKEYGYF